MVCAYWYHIIIGVKEWAATFDVNDQNENTVDIMTNPDISWTSCADFNIQVMNDKLRITEPI